MGKPRPLLYASPHRPTCAPIEVGKAVSPRDRALFLQLHLAGHSFKAISKMPHIGRHRKTIARIVNRLAAAAPAWRRRKLAADSRTSRAALPAGAPGGAGLARC
jgi:hypothetical protein